MGEDSRAIPCGLSPSREDAWAQGWVDVAFTASAGQCQCFAWCQTPPRTEMLPGRGTWSMSKDFGSIRIKWGAGPHLHVPCGHSSAGQCSGVQVLIRICEQLLQSWTPPKHLLQPPRGDHGDTSPEVPLDHGMLNLAKMAKFQCPEEPQALGDHRSLWGYPGGLLPPVLASESGFHPLPGGTRGFGGSCAKYLCHQRPGSGMSPWPRPTSWPSLTHSSQGMYSPHTLLTPSSALSLKRFYFRRFLLQFLLFALGFLSLFEEVPARSIKGQADLWKGKCELVTPAAAEGFFCQVWVVWALVFVMGFFWMVGSSSLYGCALLRQVGQSSRILWTTHKIPWAQREAHGFSLSREEFSLGGSCPE